MLRRSLKFREAEYGPHSSKIAWTLRQLAYNLQRTSQVDEAIQLFERSLKIEERTYGVDSSEHIYTLTNLSWSYSALERLPEAEAVTMRAFDLAEKAHGADAIELRRLLTQMGYIRRQQSRYPEALEAAERALRIAEGPKGSPEEQAQALVEIGKIYERQGRFDVAVETIRKALRLVQARYGDQHIETASVREDLGSALASHGSLAEAEQLQRTALRIRETKLGQENLFTAFTQRQLAYTLNLQDRMQESRRLYEMALRTDEKLLGPTHSSVAWGATGVGRVLYDESKYPEAEAYFRRAADIHRKNNSPDLATALQDLSGVLRYTNRLAEAESVVREALAITEKSSPDTPWLATTLSDLAWVLAAQGRDGDARPLYERALDIRTRTLPPKHRALAWSHNQLGLIAEREKKWAEALDHYRAAGEIVATIGSTNARTRLTQYDEVTNKKYIFGNIIDAAYILSLEDYAQSEVLSAEAFEAAQRRGRTQTSGTLSRVAARLGATNTPLASLVRELQDHEAVWAKLDNSNYDARAVGPGGALNSEALARIFAEQSGIEEKIEAARARISQEYPQYAELANPQPLSVSAVQELLQPNEVLALFTITADDTYLWLIGREHTQWRALRLGSTYLTNTNDKLRCGLDRAAWLGTRGERCKTLLPNADAAAIAAGTMPLPFDHAAAHELYEDLFGWYLEAEAHLLIVPYGPLTSLPFQVLATEEQSGDGLDRRTTAWLGTRQPITVLPSVESLAALRKVARPATATASFLGLGNPLLQGDPNNDMDKARSALAEKMQTCNSVAAVRELKAARDLFELAANGIRSVTLGAGSSVDDIRRLPPVPETAGLLCDIAQHLGAGENDLMLGQRASETQLKALSASGQLATYKVVNFATHGVVAGEVEGGTEPGLDFDPSVRADRCR